MFAKGDIDSAKHSFMVVADTGYTFDFKASRDNGLVLHNIYLSGAIYVSRMQTHESSF